LPNTPNKNLPYPAPGDPADVPTDMGELALAIDGLAFSAWMTGDTKVSAQAATHADPGGGTWYLADGSAIPAGQTGLIALLGPNFPDARGRALIMKGTHADVNAFGKSDPAAVGSRSPVHKSSVTDPQHSHAGVSIPNAASQGPGGSPPGVQATGATSPAATGITVGPAAAGVTDAPAYAVVGNLFYHS